MSSEDDVPAPSPWAAVLAKGEREVGEGDKGAKSAKKVRIREKSATIELERDREKLGIVRRSCIPSSEFPFQHMQYCTQRVRTV